MSQLFTTSPDSSGFIFFEKNHPITFRLYPTVHTWLNTSRDPRGRHRTRSIFLNCLGTFFLQMNFLTTFQGEIRLTPNLKASIPDN